MGSTTPEPPALLGTPPPAVPTGPPSAPLPRRPRSVWLRDLFEVLLVALVIYGVIQTCVETVRVDGDSMQNTLQNSDFLLASKISYVFGSPARGDIVIINPPHDCGPTASDYVKRVVGMPGDNLEIDTATLPFTLLVQPGGTGPWDVIHEPYLPNSWVFNISPAPGVTANAVGRVLHIPSGMYFVMGDNRNESCDSRYFGLVPRRDILAKAILRIWPFSRFGSLGPGPQLVVSGTTPVGAPVAGIAAGIPLGFSPRRRRRLRRMLRGSTAGAAAERPGAQRGPPRTLPERGESPDHR